MALKNDRYTYRVTWSEGPVAQGIGFAVPQTAHPGKVRIADPTGGPNGPRCPWGLIIAAGAPLR